MTEADDDEAILARLFLEELDAQLGSLSPSAPFDDARRAIHKLKGSAGLVGHRALGDAFARHERRLLAGDESARQDAETLAAETLVALRSGQPIPVPRWPQPPRDLHPSSIDPALEDGYRGAMRDRLARLDDALAASTPEEGALAAYREIHAIKGAALSVGDEVVAWFCHGLEARLGGAHTSREGALAALREVSQRRAVLAETIASPDAALATLRGEAEVVRASMRPAPRGLPLPPRRPGTMRAPAEPRTGKPADATVRVGADTLQDVFDRLEQLGQVPAPLAAGVADLQASALVARQVHRTLLEARRRIGPPRPWGPPAAAVDAIAQGAERVAELAGMLERVAERVRNARVRMSADTAAAQTSIASMRTTQASHLFDRVQAAARADARRAGHLLRVEVEGAETPLDRELCEALTDPLLQLARNAVAHGIEPAAERERRGKPPVFLLRLSAVATAGSLTIVVEDDGAGVDLAEVRSRAIERGVLAPELASLLDDVRLLSFLFRPGFSTRTDADLLAGRGLGLDVVLAATHRAGGTLRLRTRPGYGFSASISVPSGATLLDVLWLRAGAAWFAVPAAHVLRVESLPEPGRLHLAALVGQTAEGPGRAAVRVAVRPRADADAIELAVDAIGGRDEVHLRAIEPLVRATGPWGAAIAWGDAIRMSLDPQALVDQAHALLQPPGAAPSPASLRLRT